MHYGALFRPRRRSPPAPDKQACRSPRGVCEVDSTSKLAEPHRKKLRKYDARCCIILTEGYRAVITGERVKTIEIVLMMRYRPKQGEIKQDEILRIFRLCDGGGHELENLRAHRSQKRRKAL